MKKIIPLMGVVLIGQFFILSAHAAQNAKVVVDSATVYEKPQVDSKVVGTVNKDTTIAVSNVATNGFYKSRIPSGAIGWISGNDISTGAVTGAPAKAQTESSPKKKKNEETSNSRSRVLISGGIQSLSNSGFPANIPITGSKTGYGGTIEMQFKINELFYWGGRAEYFTSASAQLVDASNAQTLKFHTMPLMVGLMVVPINESNYRVGAGLYAGVSLLTSLAVTQTKNSAAVTYTSTDICEFANIQGSYAILSNLSLLGDLGYRMHSASYPLTSAASLNAPAFKANFGGIVARFGIEYKL